MATKKMTPPVVGNDNPKRTLNDAEMSLGNLRNADYPPTKTDGIKIRGTGAATKGVKARGPMA